MKLYFAPGACSIGIHYLLEEIAQPFERQRVDIRNGQHLEPWYVAINPKRKVPLLQRADGSVLTEFPVIARYVAEQAPLAELMPKDPEAVLRASELTEFLVSTIHMQGFSRTFRPEKFAADESTFEATRARGRDIIRDGLSAVEDRVKLETARDICRCCAVLHPVLGVRTPQARRAPGLFRSLAGSEFAAGGPEGVRSRGHRRLATHVNARWSRARRERCDGVESIGLCGR